MSRAPLTGDQIADAMSLLGVDDLDVFCALVACEVSGRDMDVIVGLGGARVGGHADPVACWAGLAEMVAVGVPAEQILRARDAGLADAATNSLRDLGVDLDLAIACARFAPEFPMALGAFLHYTRPAGIPDWEIPLWVAANIFRADAPIRGLAEAVAVACRWRSALGERAAPWASAGYALDEAKSLDVQGFYDADMLNVLAALRR